MAKKVLITSALLYANGPVHFGHIAGAYLPGDCYARFERLKGSDVLYLCGSDEYGVAITLSAEQAKRTPKEHVDLYHEMNKNFFEKLRFSFDLYGRTSTEEHAKTTQEFFLELQKHDLIEERREDHLYSEAEGRFLADRYVVGTCPKCGFENARGDECQKCASSYEAIDLKNPRSKLSNSLLTLKPSTHLYLRFDLFKEKLKKWIEKKPWKENVINFSMQYIDNLKPRGITRDSKWGVSVPGYSDKVFYVWFDAPIGYISIAKEWAKKQNQPDLWKEYWMNPECKLVHCIGKDNIPFHTVFFPAVLMGQEKGYKLPDAVPANEFLNLEGRQFSKSDGWYIDLEDFFKRYSVDQLRYTLASNAPENSDAEFSWKDFQMRCNTQLLGKLGNFVNRVLVFAKKQCTEALFECPKPDTAFRAKMKELILLASESFETFQLRKACHYLMDLATLGNVYFDTKKPWVLAKDPKAKELLQSTIADCLECMKNIALIASSIIPDSAQKIWEMLGFSSELSQENWDEVYQNPIPKTNRLKEVKILFRKIEDHEVEEEIARLGNSVKKTALPPIKELMEFEQFEKIDLRVGEILEASKIAKSKKLLQFLIDLGGEKRTILSGISAFYSPEELIGKKVVVVANLKPVKIMGIESQGMILAAGLEDTLELPFLQNMEPGTPIS